MEHVSKIGVLQCHAPLGEGWVNPQNSLLVMVGHYGKLNNTSNCGWSTYIAGIKFGALGPTP